MAMWFFVSSDEFLEVFTYMCTLSFYPLTWLGNAISSHLFMVVNQNRLFKLKLHLFVVLLKWILLCCPYYYCTENFFFFFNFRHNETFCHLYSNLTVDPLIRAFPLVYTNPSWHNASTLSLYFSPILIFAQLKCNTNTNSIFFSNANLLRLEQKPWAVRVFAFCEKLKKFIEKFKNGKLRSMYNFHCVDLKFQWKKRQTRAEISARTLIKKRATFSLYSEVK